jgi:ankyrin repeat protein
MNGSRFESIQAEGHARQHNGHVFNTTNYSMSLEAVLWYKSGEELTFEIQTTRPYQLLPNVALKPIGDQVHTDLLRACGEGQRPSRLTYLLNNGADIEHGDEKSCTPLHHAAFSGSTDTVRYLLDAGADIHAVATWCGSALCLAALRRHRDVVEVLLAYGAKVNQLCPMLGSAAHAACVGGDMEIVRTLVQAGADLTTKAETCLDVYDNLILSHVDTLYKLPKDYRGRRLELRFLYASASITAVERGFCEIVQFFLDLPDRLSANEEFLSGAPQDPNDRNSARLYVYKATIIMMAASRHGPEMLDLLLSRGANATAVDSSQRTAIDYLSRIPIFDTAQDADPVKCISTLVRNGVDVNAVDRDGSTALMVASLYGAGFDIVTALLDAGALVNATNAFGNSALMMTVIRGRRFADSGVVPLLRFVELLCERGAGVALTNSSGKNALSIAREGPLGPAWDENVHELERVLARYQRTDAG